MYINHSYINNFILYIDYFFNIIRTDYISSLELFKLLIIAIFRLILLTINFYLALSICLFFNLDISSEKIINIFLKASFYYLIRHNILYNFSIY